MRYQIHRSLPFSSQTRLSLLIPKRLDPRIPTPLSLSCVSSSATCSKIPPLPGAKRGTAAANVALEDVVTFAPVASSSRAWIHAGIFGASDTVAGADLFEPVGEDGESCGPVKSLDARGVASTVGLS